MLYKQLVKYLCIFSCILIFQPIFVQGQAFSGAPDTMRLTLLQAEKQFLDSNLQLLAAHYNIQSEAALVEQARKWDNPLLVTDQNLYTNKKFFQHGVDKDGNPQGEVFVQVQQLIKTAGKRGKQVDLARTNVNIAEWQFKNVMRNLRATLKKDFYTIASLEGNAALFNDNMQRLEKLQGAMKQELAAGNIARKEYLRVQALIISLKQDMVQNSSDLLDAESELKTILQVTGNVFILPLTNDDYKTAVPAEGISQLLDSAKKYNTDYNQQMQQLQYNRQNLKLQRALAIPDITVGTEFDQSANYAPNYYGLALSLPLPLWDRNRGNIKSAGWQVKQEEVMMRQVDQKLDNDVLNAYQKLMLAVKLNENTSDAFYRDYSQLYMNIVESYNSRQIGMIEFLEYFNDYQQVRKNQLQQILNLHLAAEELNDVVGVDVSK